MDDEVTEVKIGKNTKCGTCNEKLQMKCLCCDICNKLICCSCLNVSTKLFNILKESNSTALLVACQKCRTNTFNTIKKEIEQRDTLQMSDKKFENIVQKLESLSTKVEDNMKKLERIETLNESIKQAPAKLRSTYA